MQIPDLRPYTDTELRALYNACALELNARRQVKRAEVIITFRIGDKVSFKGRYNIPTEGTVTKINPTTVIVQTEQGSWKCAPTLLTKVG